MALKIYSHMEKGYKPKVRYQKGFGANVYVSKSFKGKTDGRLFMYLPTPHSSWIELMFNNETSKGLKLWIVVTFWTLLQLSTIYVSLHFWYVFMLRLASWKIECQLLQYENKQGQSFSCVFKVTMHLWLQSFLKLMFFIH